MNFMPESIRDRPTSAHEHIFLLSKTSRYFYDADAVQEPMVAASASRYAYTFGGTKNLALKAGDNPTAVVGTRKPTAGRNLRNVWAATTQPYRGAHFATMPPKIAERCLRAGTRVGDAVLDPFAGAGTTGLAASLLGRRAVLIDINGEYVELARTRIAGAIKKQRMRAESGAGPSPVIDSTPNKDVINRLPMTADADDLVSIFDLTASEAKKRIRLRRAADTYRAKTRERGERLVSLWAHDTRTLRFRAEAERQSAIIEAAGGHNDA
jgi:hypothetical protein